MIKRILFIFMMALKLLTHEAQAQLRDLDGLLNQDMNERIQKINDMTVHLNTTLAELQKVQFSLNEALAIESSTRGVKVFLRNAGAAAAAVSLAGTILYQLKGLNPNNIILAGGYGLTALSGTLAWMENRSIVFTRAEILTLQASVKDLEGRIEIEKRNLGREIRLLCLERGGSPDECEL